MIVKFFCEVCGTGYSTKEYAEACEKSSPPQPTDIIIGKKYFERAYIARGNKSGTATGMRLIANLENQYDKNWPIEKIGHQWAITFDRPLRDSDHYGNDDWHDYPSLPEYLVLDDKEG